MSHESNDDGSTPAKPNAAGGIVRTGPPCFSSRRTTITRFETVCVVRDPLALVERYEALEAEHAAREEKIAALEDRMLYLEAAVHHVIDGLGIDPHALPDPLRLKVYLPSAALTGVPL